MGSYKPLSLVIITGAFLSTLYLFGFWHVFGINIFEYAGINDVLISALYPFVFSIFLTFIFFFLGSILGFNLQKYKMGKEQSDESPTTESKPGWKIQAMKISLHLLSIAVLVGVWSMRHEFTKWFVLTMITGLYVVPSVIKSKFIKNLNPNNFLKISSATVVFFFGFVAATLGAGAAETITSGHGEYNVKASEVGLSATDDQTEWAYVGHVGESFFLFDLTTKNVAILSKIKNGKLLLIRNPKGWPNSRWSFHLPL